MKNFGLIGKTLSHSFSKNFFETMWVENSNNNKYHLIELADISELENKLSELEIIGFNITNPYKEQIIPFLTSVAPNASKIGSVNCVKIDHSKLIGFNTDAPAFEKYLPQLIEWNCQDFLILGSGGVSKAVQYVLQKNSLNYSVVSRNNTASDLTYDELNPETLNAHQSIINCTPLGTYPTIRDRAPLDYQLLNSKHCLVDLIYNPSLSYFLRTGLEKGCQIMNGYEMLVEQAKISWEIWNG